MLDSAGIDPTVVNGGIITGWGSNARLGHGQWMVVEADESDGSFAKLNRRPSPSSPTSTPSISTITEATRRWSRRSSISSPNIPFYGFATLCIDHPAVQRLIGRHQGPAHDHLRLSANADVRAVNLRHDAASMVFDVVLIGPHRRRLWQDAGDALPAMLGEHNVQNASPPSRWRWRWA